MYNYIRQIEVNMADEPLKVEEPLLESSSEIDKLVYDQYQIFPRHQNYLDGDKFSCSRILSDGDFQLTEPWSAKIFIEEAQKCNTLFPRSSAKKFPEKSVQKILEHPQRSLQICSCPYVAVARSLQILKEKRLTDLYRFSRKAQHEFELCCLKSAC